MKWISDVISILFISLLGSCSALDAKRKDSPWYRDGRYHNLFDDSEIMKKGFGTVLKWKLFGPRDEPAVPDAPDEGPTVKKIKGEDLLAPLKSGKIRVTWLGHATTFISIPLPPAQAAKTGRARINIITDPVFGDILGPGREAEFPLEPSEFPRVDFALVSHAHFDHCDIDSLRFLNKHHREIAIILPAGMEAWARDIGLKTGHSLEWYQTMEKAGVRVRSLPAHHWSMRMPGSRMQYHWASYLVESKAGRVYFGGDTGYSPHFRHIAKKYPGAVDAAILPIGAYSPRWFMKSSHINPPEAITAAGELGAGRLLPIHWGTFSLADEILMEPILYLEKLYRDQTPGPPAEFWRPGYQVDLPRAKAKGGGPKNTEITGAG